MLRGKINRSKTAPKKTLELIGIVEVLFLHKQPEPDLNGTFKTEISIVYVADVKK